MLVIFYRMFLDGRIMEQHKHGIVVCIHKNEFPTTPANYEPITWVNTDYRILACIRSNRLRSTVFDMLRPIHYFGVPGTTTFDALTAVRDAIAYVELPHGPLCTLSLNFTEAFDKIFHTYLLRMIKMYGYNMKFITSIQTTWYKTFFSPQINGYFLGPFPTRCSITQIFPMSNILFASILNPLICVCQGGSLVRQIDDLPGQPMLSGNNLPGFSLTSTVTRSGNVTGLWTKAR